MKKSIRDIFINIFIALIILSIVGSFVVLVIFHILAIDKEAYYQSIAYQETTFIAALALGLMIVLILPHIVNKEQIKQGIKEEIKNYWEDNYQKNVNQFISKSERDYAHISRMIAYLLMQKMHYYWAMAWAGDSVITYIRRFEEQPADFRLNREYFKFSLKIMKISFKKRGEGTFLEDNVDLEGDLKSKKSFFFKKINSELNKKDLKDLMNPIRDKIYKGEEITPEEKEISAVKEFKRVILRYIKWQCFIYIEIQEHKKLPNNVIRLIKERLDPAFEADFKDMVNKTLKSFYYVDGKNVDVDKEQFVNDIVEKVELEKEQEKMRKYLEKIL